MHKMAFHRARVLSIVERISADAECHSQQPLATAADSSMLSDGIAPPLQPIRAEVFLPYSLPGHILNPPPPPNPASPLIAAHILANNMNKNWQKQKATPKGFNPLNYDLQLGSNLLEP
jgi:hypothetical protein